MKKFLMLMLMALIMVIYVSCASIKPYQMMYLNDEEMKLTDRKAALFEADFHAYREGAVGGTIGNSGSGCGCN